MNTQPNNHTKIESITNKTYKASATRTVISRASFDGTTASMYNKKRNCLTEQKNQQNSTL